ncbi:hypothetical protein PIB30_016133 [Stylosanthes scabra]|uniref:Uncharacterized protein n=1 Tax=Stylosanthes scabra TaxID=79078 RepID=A0ABU6S758_9FABA|nr:hypothetical protein [Stylosanthes scabra]
MGQRMRVLWAVHTPTHGSSSLTHQQHQTRHTHFPSFQAQNSIHNTKPYSYSYPHHTLILILLPFLSLLSSLFPSAAALSAAHFYLLFFCSAVNLPLLLLTPPTICCSDSALFLFLSRLPPLLFSLQGNLLR